MRYLFDIWHESHEPNVPTEDRLRAIIEFGPDGKTFTAWLPPLAKFRPWIPFNYLDWIPSWRADESGQIRMKRVPNTERCLPDAPVVMVADQQKVQHWAAYLKI
jgi:hypothetical protein